LPGVGNINQTFLLALMKFKFYHIVCILSWVTTLSCLSFSVSGQGDAQLRSLFGDYSTSWVQEEIFVHCDKDLYLTGELCWFKLYCVDAVLHRPIGMSKLAYWELLDRTDKPVAQLKIGLREGFGTGSYLLPESLSSGIYKIRCYTNWMKNFDAAFYFEKEITVINPHQFYDKDTLKKEHACSLRCYPEGGNLVNGIPSTVAFRVVNPDGKGVDAHGFVIDDLGDTVRMIRSVRMGIGRFVVTPQRGRSYRAIVMLSNGEKAVAELPKTDSGGFVMHLSDSGGGRLKIAVESGGEPVAGAVATTGGLVYLFVHTRGSVKIVQGNMLINNRASFVIDKSRLGDGISHITIFDAGKRPVCERLFFKYPTGQLKVGVSSNKETYSSREKIDVTVNTMSDSGATPANLSMAVYKIDTLQAMDNMNIENYLWLSADLPEAIESPAYYFDPSNPARDSAVDDLMLTQGWRRFNWEDILGGKKPVFSFLPEYTGHIITGKFFDSATKTAVRNRGVFVSSPGIHPIFGAASSDSNGMLRFDMGGFYTGGQLFVRSEKLEDSLYTIEIRSPFSATYSQKRLPLFSFAVRDSVALAEYQKDIIVQREYMGARLGKFSLPAVDTTSFYGKPDVSYLLDDYVRFTTMEEVLREYVAQTSVRNRGGQFEVSVWDRRRDHSLLEPAPLVLLDGVPTDINRVIGYDPLKVKRLDIVTEAFYYGNLAFGGILNFVTYNGDLPGFDLDPHTIVMDYGGLEAQRVFYSPAYGTREEVESRLPDFRRLLYWQPNVMTDKRGATAESFFSSDSPGRYVIVVQGVSSDGKVGYAVKWFTVQR
jgi:hypothetical protein